MTANLSIIIVNWNAGDLLRRSIESVISSCPGISYEVIVVDNASHDNSLELLRKSQPSATLISNGRLRIVENFENKGFDSANQAFDLAQSQLVLLLNPDTEVLPGAIDTLVKTIHSDPKIGACGPKILNTDGSIQISVWHNPPSALPPTASGKD